MHIKPQERLAGVLTQVRRVVDAQGPDGPTDGELLARFVAARDQAAFELLVWRHGAMVLHTCRRLLSRLEDAEDAFQATFLALVRQAAGISRREAVAGWLHRVACRVATRLRTSRDRRALCERESVHQTSARVSPDEAVDPLVWAEVRQVLDREVDRLPAKLRVPFVLCYLEGMTNEEAARHLDLPRGTVLSRLARARERLRGRLERRGLALTAGAFVLALGQETAASAALTPLVANTIKAAMLIAAGQATAAVVSAPVALLTEGVVRAMFLSKVKMAMAVVLSIGLVSGAGGIVYRTQAAGQAPDPIDNTPGQVRNTAPADGKKAATPSADSKANLVAPSELRAAQARLDAAKARTAVAEHQYQRTQEELLVIKASLDQARAEQEYARVEYDRLKQLVRETGADPKPAAVPKKAPAQVAAADAARGLAPPTGMWPATTTQTDLIQLATAYIDAVRDAQTAKAYLTYLKRAEGGIDASGPGGEIRRINLDAAERKLALLRAIIEGSLETAAEEREFAVRMHKAGFGSAGQVSASESKYKILKLILQGAN
ncbi:MAG: RNA polymerase sigma factor [Gemmataceae bacterium]|nr:RNA polymerase sigma factor [Gemmataceae bacterium]